MAVKRKAKNTGSTFRVNKGHALNDKLFHSLEKMGVLVTLKYPKSTKPSKVTYKTGTVFGILKHKATNRTKETLQQKISPSAGGYQIGIDKGLQRQGLMPGKGGDQGPNLTTTEDTVTVGATMHYSKDFDKRRKIIPDVVPKKWIEDIEKQVAEYGAELFHKVFGEEQQ
jgi:hypothetical protein